MRAHLEALATEVAAAMARLAIATTAAAKAGRRSPGGNGGAGAVCAESAAHAAAANAAADELAAREAELLTSLDNLLLSGSPEELGIQVDEHGIIID